MILSSTVAGKRLTQYRIKTFDVTELDAIAYHALNEILIVADPRPR